MCLVLAILICIVDIPMMELQTSLSLADITMQLLYVNAKGLTRAVEIGARDKTLADNQIWKEGSSVNENINPSSSNFFLKEQCHFCSYPTEYYIIWWFQSRNIYFYVVYDYTMKGAAPPIYVPHCDRYIYTYTCMVTHRLNKQIHSIFQRRYALMCYWISKDL